MKIGKWTIVIFKDIKYQFLPKIRYNNSVSGTRVSVSIYVLKYVLRIDYWKRKHFWVRKVV